MDDLSIDDYYWLNDPRESRSDKVFGAGKCLL